jgi:hypothetical protein
MKKLVIVPGGFHPWHGGHTALYNAAKEAFPSADVFVASTNDTSARPFPFKLKKTLAQAAGVPANRFIQVTSPFRAQEITQMYDPNETVLIFVRSNKDTEEMPQPGGVKKNGDLAYLQPYKRNKLEPMAQHGYMAYLPVATFGGGMTSATEIRSKWPGMRDEQKVKLVKELYPSTESNEAAADKLVQILDSVMPATQVNEVDGRLSSFFNDRPHTEKISMIWPGLTPAKKIELIQHLYGRTRPLDALRAQSMVDHIDALFKKVKPEHAVNAESVEHAENNAAMPDTFDYIDEIKL